MACAPFRHVGEEASLREQYPDWDDQSRVAYDWEGLVFPAARVIVPFVDEVWGS
jgi:hypothetical protein